MEHLKILNNRYGELEVELHKLDPCKEKPDCEGCSETAINILQEMEAISIEINLILKNNND